jgi:formylglycine-generating enzyme required for sulfatase activity
MDTARVRVLACVLVGLATGATGAVEIETVPVGNPGNAGEPSGGVGSGGPERSCGAVNYIYNMGKYEITAAQYTEFLNAVAATDTYGLYNPLMVDLNGCKIQQSGSLGSYTYSVAPDWASRPVGHVNWGDAARFANWLHNGRPTGVQDLTTTEDGSYFLNGAITGEQLLAVTRKPMASWVIPSEDEWYKAAYHKNNGVTGNYWGFATSTDNEPSNELIDPDPGNNANYNPDLGPDTHTIGAPYWRTVVGEFENSESPYGTFDQSGNVNEWTEAIVLDNARALRGGDYSDDAARLHASYRCFSTPTSESASTFGFRVAYVMDCNLNGIPDSTDVASGTSPDCDGDGAANDCVICESPLDCDDCNAGTIDGCRNGRCIHVNHEGLTVPGDMDGDGDLDLEDFAIFELCFSGPDGEIPASCPFSNGAS